MSILVYDLNTDTLTLILLQVEVRDVLALESTCKKFRQAIAELRSLWFTLLRTVVLEQSLPLPTHRKDAGEVSSATLRNWFHNAMTLRHRIRKDRPMSIDRVQTPPITWVRLVRGRWLLVAYSDETRSCLSCWDSYKEGDLTLVSEFQLTGPVVDGEIEDSNTRILIAVSLERWPFNEVQILSLHRTVERIHFTPLGHVEGASYVRFIRGEWLGFSVYNGDDTRPYISNWIRKENYVLTRKTSASPASCSCTGDKKWNRQERWWARTTCLTMTLWHNHIFAAFQYEVQVFRLDSEAGVRHLLSFELEYMDLTEAYFVDPYLSAASSTLDQTSVRDDNKLTLVTRQFDSPDELISVLSITHQPGFEESPFDVTGSDKVILVLEDLTTAICIGSTGREVIWVRKQSIGGPELWSTDIRIADRTGAACYAVILTEYDSRHSTKGMPLLIPRCEMALDDSRGTLLIGTISGKLCLVRFGNPPSKWDCLNDDIPIQANMCPVMNFTLSLQVLNLAWPHLLVDDTNERNLILNESVKRTVISSWGFPSLIEANIPVGWSADWSRFPDAEKWFPASRRLIHERLVYRGVASSRIQASYGTIGIPIPILWKTHEDFDATDSYQNAVLFRIGNRPFLWIDDIVEVPLFVDPTSNDEARILSIDEVLVDLANMLSRRQVGEMKERNWDPRWDQQLLSRAIHDTLQYITWHPEQELVKNADPEHWTEDEWTNLGRIMTTSNTFGRA